MQAPLSDALDLAIALFRQGRTPEAFKLFHHLVTQYPKDPLLTFNLGAAYAQVEQTDQAITWLETTLQLEPHHFQALGLLGQIYGHELEHATALPFLLKAYQLKPANPLVNRYLGICYARLKDFDRAIFHFDRAFKANPQDAFTGSNLFYILAKTCAFKEAYKVSLKLDQLTLPEPQSPNPTELPFINLVRVPRPAQNLKIAQIWSQSLITHLYHPPLTHPRPPRSPARLHLGYFSYDFKNHVNLHHLLGVLRFHNPKQFKVTCYAYNPPSDQIPAQRMVKAYGHQFVNLYGTNDTDSVARIREDKVHILIDINGYTTGHRLLVPAHRPAPIQVEFLGFPGTTGSNFMDYLLADTTVIPPPIYRYYTEKIASLPACYLPVSYSHLTPPPPPTRHDCHLPAKAFVFCSFNNPHKIDAAVFSAWCQILNQVPGSVLWLCVNPTAQKNLTAAAVKAGLTPNRLVFAPTLPFEAHLGRISLANLALDTFRYNGAATTTDALFMGVPVITQTGTHYASRFSTSILKAANLPELITNSTDKYINLAVNLAVNQQLFFNLKSKILNL